MTLSTKLTMTLMLESLVCLRETTDYYIWAAMKELTAKQPGTHVGKHVKGHQRATKKNQVLPPEAVMNNRMDKLAGTCRT